MMTSLHYVTEGRLFSVENIETTSLDSINKSVPESAALYDDLSLEDEGYRRNWPNLKKQPRVEPRGEN